MTSEFDPDATPTFSNAPDLAELAKTAPTKRELAWQLLKSTRNPEYVALRYGYTIAQMRAALETLAGDPNAV